MDMDGSQTSPSQTPPFTSPTPDSESGSSQQQQPPAELQSKSAPSSTTTRTGPDLLQFLTDTLNKNQKDRIHLFKIEKELIDLVKDNERQHHKFAPMSSYHRMLVHRVAAFFGMDHNVDSVGSSVIVNKTASTKLPDFKFSDKLRDSQVNSKEPQKSILKRESSSFEEMTKDCKDRSPDRRNGANSIALSADCRRSKSFEEREVQYEKARARIFNQDSSSSTEGNDSSYPTSGSSGENTSSSTSGIALSVNLTSSSQSELSSQDAELKSNNNGGNNNNNYIKDSSVSNKQSESGPWSSLESATSASGRPRFLRLQRQKRIPNSFDSDSTRTSFTLSSSISSSGGMFLTPDCCLPDQSLCDASAARSSFTKASSFGGLSFLNRDNSSGMNCEPKLTKTGSLNVPSLADNGSNLPSLPFGVSSQEASVISSQSNTLISPHTWPKKQFKSISSSSSSNTANDNEKVSQNNIGSSPSKTDIASFTEVSKGTNQASVGGSMNKCESNEENHQDNPDCVDPTTSKGHSHVGNPNENTQTATGNNSSKHKSFNQSHSSHHHKSLSKSSSQYSNVSHNHPNLYERQKIYSHSEKEKSHLGPANLIITPVGACMPPAMNPKNSMMNQRTAPLQPIYYLPYVQANLPSINKHIVNQEDHSSTGNRNKSNRNITNQMSSLSINCHVSRSGPNNCGAPANLVSDIRNINGQNCRSVLTPQVNICDMNLRGSGYSIPPNTSRGHKSSSPLTKMSNTPRMPLCFMTPNMPGSNGHAGIRLPTPNTLTSVMDPNAVTAVAYNDRYMSALSTHQALSHTTNAYLNAPNVPGTQADLDLMYQAANQHSKSNVLLLSSQSIPANNSFQTVPMHPHALQGIPSIQSIGSQLQTPPQSSGLCPPPHQANIPSNAGPITSLPSTSPAVVANSIHLRCNSGLATPSTSQFSYALNPLPLPPNSSHAASGTAYSYAHPIQAPPNMPMYVTSNSGVSGGSPQIISVARPPPSQVLQHPMSSQTPIYRPVPLFFLFNFQNKRSN